MKKLIPLMLLLLVANLLNAQENTKGYFINNEGQKIECTILDDVNNNPTNFNYKLASENQTRKADIATVKEFGVYNVYKFIRDTVIIDRSADDDIRSISKEKSPEFKQEILFLNVLVEGKATLYQYQIRGLLRYFFKVGDSSINQLVYKKYEIDAAIKENNSFREQLWIKLPCESKSMDYYNSIKYEKAALIDFFNTYNKCQNSSSLVYNGLRKKAEFNLTIRPRINYTSFSAENLLVSGSRESAFESKLQPGIGIEAEILVPFNKHKHQWAVIAEPNFFAYKSEYVAPTNTIVNGFVTTSVDYKSIDLPLGLRYYFHFGLKTKVFINAVILQSIGLNSSFTQTRSDGLELYNLNVKTLTTFAGGVGLKYGKSFSSEIRYYPSRTILGDYSIWSSRMNTVSFVVGYKLF